MTVFPNAVAAARTPVSWDKSAVAAALGHLDPGLTVRMYCEETLGPREEVFLDIEEHEQDDRMKKGPSHRGARRERKITGEDKAKKT